MLYLQHIDSGSPQLHPHPEDGTLWLDWGGKPYKMEIVTAPLVHYDDGVVQIRENGVWDVFREQLELLQHALEEFAQDDAIALMSVHRSQSRDWRRDSGDGPLRSNEASTHIFAIAARVPMSNKMEEVEDIIYDPKICPPSLFKMLNPNSEIVKNPTVVDGHLPK